MESPLSKEAQVDFGKGAFVEQPSERKQRLQLFLIVLSYSRKGYSEVAWHMDLETLIRRLRRS